MTDEEHVRSSEHVGPILFAHETTREQLRTVGSVVTFRRERRTVGDTWWRASRTGPKQGDVTVEELAEVQPTTSALRPYQEESGFETVDAWRETIEDLNGYLPDTGYLYRATERSASSSKSTPE
ncbi:MAG TPA: hypothetical protein VFJ06_14300 [Halococcus sp.]|nr:hypothetical protein [Halococcus sp.]